MLRDGAPRHDSWSLDQRLENLETDVHLELGAIVEIGKLPIHKETRHSNTSLYSKYLANLLRSYKKLVLRIT